MFTACAAVHLGQRHGDERIGGAPGCTLLSELAQFRDRFRVQELVHSTFPVCRIDRVRQINARQMYGMYLLRMEEMLAEHRSTGTVVKELVLYHVTTEKRGVESLENGLDWRRTRRSRFGRGVSFSDDADYADFYANRSSGEDHRVILVCSVLVAKTFRVTKAGYGLAVPPGVADTTMSSNGRVYVKFNDMEFYPLYMVYYRRRKEDLCKSRYFSLATNNIEQEVEKQLQQQHEQRQQQQREQRQQQQREQRQQQQMRQQYNSPRQHRHEDNNKCLIL